VPCLGTEKTESGPCITGYRRSRQSPWVFWSCFRERRGKQHPSPSYSAERPSCSRELELMMRLSLASMLAFAALARSRLCPIGLASLKIKVKWNNNMGTHDKALTRMTTSCYSSDVRMIIGEPCCRICRFSWPCWRRVHQGRPNIPPVLIVSPSIL